MMPSYAPSDHHKHVWKEIPGTYPDNSPWVYLKCEAEPWHSKTVRRDSLGSENPGHSRLGGQVMGSLPAISGTVYIVKCDRCGGNATTRFLIEGLRVLCGSCSADRTSDER